MLIPVVGLYARRIAGVVVFFDFTNETQALIKAKRIIRKTIAAF